MKSYWLQFVFVTLFIHTGNVLEIFAQVDFVHDNEYNLARNAKVKHSNKSMAPPITQQSHDKRFVPKDEMINFNIHGMEEKFVEESFDVVHYVDILAENHHISEPKKLNFRGGISTADFNGKTLAVSRNYVIKLRKEGIEILGRYDRSPVSGQTISVRKIDTTGKYLAYSRDGRNSNNPEITDSEIGVIDIQSHEVISYLFSNRNFRNVDISTSANLKTITHSPIIAQRGLWITEWDGKEFTNPVVLFPTAFEDVVGRDALISQLGKRIFFKDIPFAENPKTEFFMEKHEEDWVEQPIISNTSQSSLGSS